MDSLTQIVLGAAVGETVLGKKVGNKAALYGGIAGTIPDLDVLLGFFVDEVTAIEWHRGFSHSILFSLLASPLLGKLVSKLETQATWLEWSKLFFWGLLTHPLLDAFTTWGTQLFWPFSTKLAFKSIFVIDPLYTLPFLFFLIWALRLPKTSVKRRKIIKLALMISSAYLLFTLALKGYAHHQFTTALQDQAIRYQAIQTRPAAFNTVLWNANVMRENDFLLADFSMFDSQPIAFRSFPKNEYLLQLIAHDPAIERLKNITQGWYILTTDESEQLYLHDLRFGLLSPHPKENSFVFSYSLLNLETGSVEIKELPKTRGDAKKLLIELWERMKGN